jgi:uncharacterized protein (TIGR02284 family)
MIKNEEIVEELNELVKINNDRIQGYMKAVEDNKDPQLDHLFNEMIVQSQNFRSQLANHIVRIDGSAVSDATTTDLSSKIHRAWIDIKAAVTGNDRDAVLSSVTFGESAAIEAYEDAIEDDDLPAYIKEELTNHLTQLKAARDKMEALKN